MQEGRLDRKARHREAAARLQPDLVERRGEIIVGEMVAAAAQPLGEADRELALAAEARDRLAQLLDAREAGVVVADLDVKSDHARILAACHRSWTVSSRSRWSRHRPPLSRPLDGFSVGSCAGRATAPSDAGSGRGANGPVTTKTTTPAIASSVTVADGGQQANDEPPHGALAPL